MHRGQAQVEFECLDMPPGEVHLWYLHEGEIQSDHLLEAYRELLSEDERARASRFVFQRLEHQYILSRALLRCVLSHYAPLKPREWCFGTGAFGRPYILNRDVLPGSFSFNLTHTSELAACAVTVGGTVGIDAEAVTADAVSLLDLAQRFFAEPEVASLNRLPANEIPEAFFRYWTLKEAYTKAVGRGLHIPLNQFRFDLRCDDTIEVAFDPALADSPDHWQFWLLNPSERHIAALCLEVPKNSERILYARRIVPLTSCTPFSASLPRRPR
jgi:4'-phosphopantetheinyl transferase